jgi:hypothetical protein
MCKINIAANHDKRLGSGGIDPPFMSLVFGAVKRSASRTGLLFPGENPVVSIEEAWWTPKPVRTL